MQTASIGMCRRRCSSTTVRRLYVAEGQSVKQNDKLLMLANGKTFTADFDGRVNVINFAEGDSVVNGDELIQIADFDQMKVSVRVDEYDISDVSVGQSCRITTTATEHEYESTIAAINYISSSTGNVAYYTATAYVDVSSGVYPGMQVTVTVPQQEAANVVVLREDALSFSDDNRAFVYTQNADGSMAETYVTTGVSNGNYVEIKAGLNAGDRVYTEVQTETQNSVASLLTSLFSQQRINGAGGTRNNGTNSTRTNPNGSGFGGGTTTRQNAPGGTAPGGNGGGR